MGDAEEKKKVLKTYATNRKEFKNDTGVVAVVVD
jgi:hypothetical protein